MRTLWVTAALLLVWLGTDPGRLVAQEPGPLDAARSRQVPARGFAPPELYVTGGVLDRADFRGDGASGAVGLRGRLPIGGWFVIEPALSVGRFEGEGLSDSVDRDVTLAVLDFQLQLERPFGRFRPFAGIGAGGAADFRGRRGTNAFVASSYSLALGTVMEVGRDVLLLGEARVRTLDQGRGTELSLGLGFRL